TRDGDYVLEVGFWSTYTLIYNPNDVPELIDQAYEKIQRSIEAFAEKGSGWVIHCVHVVYIKVAKNEPLRPSSYIPLPRGLKVKKKAIVNVENHHDNKCFLYS